MTIWVFLPCKGSGWVGRRTGPSCSPRCTTSRTRRRPGWRRCRGDRESCLGGRRSGSSGIPVDIKMAIYRTPFDKKWQLWYTCWKIACYGIHRLIRKFIPTLEWSAFGDKLFWHYCLENDQEFLASPEPIPTYKIHHKVHIVRVSFPT